MIHVTKRLIGSFWLTVLGLALPAHSQDPKLEVRNLNPLASKAVESVEISLNETQLQFVRKLARLDMDDQTTVGLQLSKLSSVYVRMFEFAQDGEYSETDVEPIRAQLRAPGWEPFRSEAANDGFVMRRNGVIVGYAAIYSEGRKLCVINVTGRMSQEDIRELKISGCGRWNGNRTQRRSR